MYVVEARQHNTVFGVQLDIAQAVRQGGKNGGSGREGGREGGTEGGR